MKKILIIDDDHKFAETLKGTFVESYNASIATTVPAALTQLSSDVFDVILCDYLLGNDDCFSVLSFLKKFETHPKIFIMTGFTNLEMAVKLLNQKIDGFFEKPISFEEVKLRIDAEFENSNKRIDNKLSLNSYEKVIVIGNNQIFLTDVEFRILDFLINQKEKWVSRNDIISFVWKGPTVSRNTLDTHLSNLKKKVPQLKEQIKVARGKGYFYSPNGFKSELET